MSKDWQQMSDDDLVNEADTGLRGQGAPVEMMRRLRNALVDQLESTTRLTKRITWLTYVLVVLTVVIVGLTAGQYGVWVLP